MITEKTIYDQIFNILQNANLSEIGSNNGYSIELGEIVLHLFSKFTKQQKIAFKSSFSYENAYLRQSIDIDSETIRLEYIDFNSEFETMASLTQHELFDGTEDDMNRITFENMKDLTDKQKLNMMYELDLKPYLRDKVTIDIFKRECFVNMTHTHQYVILTAILDKSIFNYTMYEDINTIAHKILLAYYDMLLHLNRESRVQQKDTEKAWHIAYTYYKKRYR